LGEAENRVVRRLFTDYGQDMDTDELIVYLEMSGVISEDRAEVISRIASDRDKQRHLIRALIRQSMEGLNPLVAYFQQSSVDQKHISDWLSGQIRDIENGGNGGEMKNLSETERKRIKCMLVSSRVPSVKKEVRREGLIAEVKEALDALANDDAFFVVLHGLPGSGKSSLAASVVREEQLFLHHFDSVIWMMDCHENTRDLTLFMADLLVFLTDSTELKEDLKPPSDKSSIIFLTKLVGESLIDHPNTLIVVDGVMTRETVSWMDHLNVRVLATTRDALLFEEVSQPMKMIKVDGLEETQVAQVFKEGREKEVDRWAVKRMRELSEGLPYVIKQLHKLTDGKENEFPYWISRIERSGILSLPNANSYEKENLSVALENHYSIILDELKEPLHSLVVFPPTVFIPIEILPAVIPIDVCDREDIIHELSIVMGRLAKLGWVEKIMDKRKDIYRVPRIVHEFLVKKVEKSKRNEKKKELMKGEERMENEETREMMRGWLEENGNIIRGKEEIHEDHHESQSSLMSMFKSFFSWVPNLRGSQ
ncbi:hypothetical protein PENTCL1PPCAC_11714, partial [Pristionchus entomophagus]